MSNIRSNGNVSNLDFGANDVNVGSSIVTNIPLRWDMLIVGEVVHVWGQGHTSLL